jgi:hypothetical protein
MTPAQRTHPDNDTPYLCRYSRQPFDDCYCRKVTGRTVPNIVLYCMERYRECPIYRKQALTAYASGD